MQRIKQRERRKTQSNYTGSFHKPEVVLSPLHFQGEFTKNAISDYNAQAQLQETSNAQEHNQKTSNAQTHKQETSYQTELQEKCLTLEHLI